jgi:uncharacterized membrane protein HdeD (DUF308 family)
MNHYPRHKNPLALRQLKENENWYLILGIGLVILGTLAVMFSLISTIISILYLGAFFIVVGVFEAMQSFKMNRWTGFILHLLLAIFYVGSGIFIILNPAVGAVSLTLFLGIFFVLMGILRIIFSLIGAVLHRGWLLLNGIITLLLGALIWYEWPYSSIWVIGTFVGIDTIITGWTWIMLSLRVKNLHIED